MPELPRALPPGERTMGQLIGETIRVYGDNFWRALPLGIPLALVEEACVHRSVGAQIPIFLAAAPLIAGAYVWACAIVNRASAALAPFLLALLIYLPFPLLRAIYTLPAVAWFALIGLAVPAALVESSAGTGSPLGFLRRFLTRGLELGRADYVHALGSLSALVIVVGIGEQALGTLLHSMGDASPRVALALADVVLSPLLYLGGAMLYLDQAARVGAVRPGRGGAPKQASSSRRG